MIQSFEAQGTAKLSLWELFRVLIAPGLPLAAPNLLSPAGAGIRPRVDEVSDRSAADRANTQHSKAPPPDSQADPVRAGRSRPANGRCPG
jgi:hypothetical protein